MPNTIPASQIVNVTPNVLSAGGSALDLSGVVGTTNSRVPIGEVLSFASADDVSTYFGANSDEADIAAIYFNGFDNSNVKPGQILFAQDNVNAVSAYLRGGNVSGLTLTQLKAITGTILITVDGYAYTSGSIDLSTAVSFSTAAGIIQTDLNASLPQGSAFTGSIAAGTGGFTGSIAGTILTVTAVGTGAIIPGALMGTGAGVAAGTKIVSQLTGASHGIGTYVVSIPQTVASGAMTSSYGILTVTVIGSGTIAVGQTITGTGGGGVTANTIITEPGTGVGGTGTYYVNLTQSVTSTNSLVGSGTAVAVTYDSVSGAFVVTSGINGDESSIAFPTGTAVAALKLTEATGAILSQGADPATPTSFMNMVKQVTQDWATFMLAFDPDYGSGTTEKLAFANWANDQGNRYAFVCWDTDITPTESSDASTSLGQLLIAGDYSGTCPIYAPDYEKAAFVCGVAASIDFTETNGRITFAFKGQSGLTADVTDATSADNLIANGYNFYGIYATANDQFKFFNPGSVSGPFEWMDSYIDQIWLNNQLQLALMVLLTTVKSIPYNNAGYALIRAACLDPLNQAVNNGVIRKGVTLSEAQKAEINSAAGGRVDSYIFQQGWYLQILDALPQVRAARGSPPMTLWYADGGSVQQINLTSVEVQ